MRIISLFFLLLALLSCSQKGDNKSFQLMGQTMGTSWHITIVKTEDNHSVIDGIDNNQLKQLIDNELKMLNQQFSTYIPDSVISRFNAQQTTQPVQVTQELLHVVDSAQIISEKTKGAFDITIAPLIQLWGFGTDISVTKPEDLAITKTLKATGYQFLTLHKNPPLLKKNIPQLSLNLSAIAKGYAVDKLAMLLNNQGFQNYLVEIGGELRVKGHNPQGDEWQIAIEKPISDHQRTAQEIISLHNIAVATSGDYHNYFEEKGVRYSHTLNPTTGRPINHKLASVTVLHPSTMMADAYATAIMVLGETKGLQFAKQEHLQIYMIIRNDTGFKIISTLLPRDTRINE